MSKIIHESFNTFYLVPTPCITANEITVFEKKGNSLQIKVITGHKSVAITHGLSMMNAMSTSQIVAFIISLIRLIGKFD